MRDLGDKFISVTVEFYVSSLSAVIVLQFLSHDYAGTRWVTYLVYGVPIYVLGLFFC